MGHVAKVQEGQNDNFSYIAVIRQVEVGLAGGCSENEITSAVMHCPN